MTTKVLYLKQLQYEIKIQKSEFQKKKINWLQISFYVKVINVNKRFVPKTIAVRNQNSNYMSNHRTL